MKKAYEELQLLLAIICLKIAVVVAPKTRKESTLMLYYMSSFLAHAKAMKGELK